jgi:hypothetical protein
MQCKLCASHFQDVSSNQDHSQIFHLNRHSQFRTKKSKIIKTSNLSVIREKDHCCLVSVNRQTYLSISLGHPTCDHIEYLRTCLFAAKPHHQLSPAPDNVHYGAYRLPPYFTTKGIVLLPVNEHPDTASPDLNSNASTAKHGINPPTQS